MPKGKFRPVHSDDNFIDRDGHAKTQGWKSITRSPTSRVALKIFTAYFSNFQYNILCRESSLDSEITFEAAQQFPKYLKWFQGLLLCSALETGRVMLKLETVTLPHSSTSHTLHDIRNPTQMGADGSSSAAFSDSYDMGIG